MNVIIDLDLQQAVQGFGSRQPALPIQVKSQDTPTVALYFVRGNVTYDLGASPGLRFGVFVAGNPNALVQQNTFTRTTDALARTVYVAYPNFNTVQMQAAIGSQPQLSAIGEIRYQTTFGTIARTADIDFTVVRTLLNETVMDNLIATFVTPAVNANVTARINNTGWLSAGLNISIAAGAGAYQVVSVTNVTDFVAKNLGGASNAASGTTIPTGTAVGIAPVNVLQAYPDPSIIEVTTHKDAINGYAGLDGGGLLKGTEMPVDTKTIVVSGGKLASSSILTTTAANFTTPVANGTVSVTLSSTSGLVAGQYVRIPIAGYYVVTSITDSTHAVLTNNGDPFNAGSGVTITSGAVLLPAQAAAGGGGGSGTPGQNAYTQTTAAFTVPAVNATVTVTVGNTAWMGGAGYLLFISGAGYYSVSSITDAAHVVLTNIGGATNAIAGTVVSSGASVAPAGPAGSTGAPGPALSAYDALASPFTMPAAAANVTISIANTAWLAVGQVIYIASAGYFQVASISSATQASVTNLNYPGNASAGGTIASGSKVSAGGLIGATGSGGAGKNAFTNLAANFTQPAVNATVSINVGTTAWMAVGQIIFVQSGGYYSVSSITDLTDAVVTNLGYSGNAAPGATITSGSTVAVTPGGVAGQAGANAFTLTTASFTMPTSGATVTVTVGATAWMAQGQMLYIPTGGYFSVSVITDATHVVLTNLGFTGNAGSATVIAAASPVVASGIQGPAGTGGGGGGSLSDAETTTGVSLIANPAGLLKRLTSIDSSVALTDNGTSINLAAAAAGIWNPASGLYLYDDFLYTSGSTPTEYGLLTGGSGTANWLSAYGQDNTRKVNGAVELATSTFSGSTGQGVARGCGNSGTGPLVPGLGALTWKARVFIESALAATGVGYFLRIGLGNSGGGANAQIVNAIYFEYSPDNNAGKWRVCTYVASAVNVNTSVTVVNDTAYDLEMDINASWTSINFLINGTLAGTVTSGIPTTALCPFIMDLFRSSGATNYLALVDYWSILYQFSR